MAKRNAFRYEISWEKDGVTHLGKRSKKALKVKPHKSTQDSSKHPPGQMMTTKVDHDVKGQEVSKGEQTISLKNLRPQDKKRVANLIKELAKVGEEKEVAMQQLTVERKEFELKYLDLHTQMNTLKTERESLQHQYLQCQKLLLECQKRLGREQAKHQKYLKSGREHEFLHNKSLTGERQDHYLEPVVKERTKEQFQPQMQSTARVLRTPESFKPPGNNNNLPLNQQTAVPPMDHHEMSSNYIAQKEYQTHPERHSSRGKRDPHQHNSRVAQQFQRSQSRTGRIALEEREASLFSPSMFSPDEFHPLPEELINSRSFEAVESGRFRSTSIPRGDYEPERLQQQTEEPSVRKLNKSEDQPTLNYVNGAKHHLTMEENRGKQAYVLPESEGYDISHGHQREHHTNFLAANQQHPEYETANSEWVGRGREGQSSSRSFHSENKEDSLQRRGHISEMMVQKQKQLEQQKMLLKREQDWLQKQLRDQEELLYQKQMELQAHRDSLLEDEDHPHRVAYISWGTSRGQSRTFHDTSGRQHDVSTDRHRKKDSAVSVGADAGTTAMIGERILHHPLSGSEPGPSSHKKDFQQDVEKGDDIIHDKVGSREHHLIHGFASLHDDSNQRRYLIGPPSNTTVDASTSPFQAPLQQIEMRNVGLSPAVHHPDSRLLEESSADSSPVRSSDKKFPTKKDQKVEAIPVKDSHFLDDLIEELNSLPSESSNSPGTIIHPAAPIRTLPDKDRSGLTSAHKSQHKTTLPTSYSSRLYGLEIVSSTDEEEESQLLDDIFFLN